VKIALFVEGKSDKDTLRILLRRLLRERASVILRVFRGRGNLLNVEKVCAVAQVLLRESPDVSKIIACVDSECTPGDQTEREIRKIEQSVNANIQHKCSVHYIAVIHALEGWLLTDPDAIIKHLGRGAIVMRTETSTFLAKAQSTQGKPRPKA